MKMRKMMIRLLNLGVREVALKMKNKKGFLLAEETLKIIIALISLGFLVYFLGALYFANQDSKELEQAESSLEFLIKEINDGRDEVTIFNPEDWILISWPYEDDRRFPDSCNEKDCICISKDPNILEQVWFGVVESGVINIFFEYSEEGFCLENPQKFIVKKNGDEQQPIVIESPLQLKITNNIITKNES